MVKQKLFKTVRTWWGRVLNPAGADEVYSHGVDGVRKWKITEETSGVRGPG